MPSTAGADASAQLIDPRGPRFAAAVTTVLLAAALTFGPVLGWPVLLVQTLAFAAGSLLGLRYQPWGWVYRVAVQPRLSPPAALEDARPPRFAQTVGLLFGLAGLLGVAAAVPALFYVAGGFALVAAVLNAVFDYCLGCEIYLLGRRVFTHAATGAAVKR